MLWMVGFLCASLFFAALAGRQMKDGEVIAGAVSIWVSIVLGLIGCTWAALIVTVIVGGGIW